MAYRLASKQLALFNNGFLQDIVREHAGVDDFAATNVPLHVTATNMDTGIKHVFSDGRVSDAVLASTAVPGVFHPVHIDGQAYLDGGIVANLDLETAVELGAKEILAIDLSHCFELTGATSVMGVITRTVDIVMRERVQRDLARLGARARITLVRPEIDEDSSVGDLRHVRRLIERGEAFAETALERCFDKRGRLVPGVVSEMVEMRPAAEGAAG
jgi:NTE family protein